MDTKRSSEDSNSGKVVGRNGPELFNKRKDPSRMVVEVNEKRYSIAKGRKS